MTGEMAWIKKDGTDSNGDCWPIHASIARQLKGELRPFDVYQGPYVVVSGHRLWIVSVPETNSDYFFKLYDETTDEFMYVYGVTYREVIRRACKHARMLIGVK